MMAGTEERSATIAVWTKGFSVTKDSPEFQMIIPASKSDLARGLEAELADSVQWPRVLDGLYRLSDRDLAYERCLLVSAAQAVVVVAGPMADRHGRRAVAVAAVAVPIDWAKPGLADTVSRAHGLAVRLLEAYTVALTDSGSGTGNVERQLRKGKFLPDRTFGLGQEMPVSLSEWESALDAVRAVRGVRGIATPRLMLLGANILLGTKHEAEVLQAKGADVDGFMDPRSGRIMPLTSAVSPWGRRPSIPVPPADVAPDLADVADEAVEVEREEAGKRQVGRSMDEARRASHDVVDAWFRFIGTVLDYWRR